MTTVQRNETNRTARLTARGVTRVFPGGAGVHGVDLDVEAGSIHALVGLNGAGKTTLMRLLLGMLRPDSGVVRIKGRTIDDADASIWRRVGHFIEGPLTYPELDTRTNLSTAARLHGIDRAAVARTVTQSLSELNLVQYASVRARVLSAGNRQRAGLAAALGHAPDLIVLDEPTSALDPSGVIMVRELLLRRAASGAGILVSSHHLDEVARVADCITLVNRGRTIGTLDPDGTDIEREFFAKVHADDQRSAA